MKWPHYGGCESLSAIIMLFVLFQQSSSSLKYGYKQGGNIFKYSQQLDLIKFSMFISFNKASESHIYMYICMDLNKQPPIKNVKENHLNYAILVL